VLLHNFSRIAIAGKMAHGILLTRLNAVIFFLHRRKVVVCRTHYGAQPRLLVGQQSKRSVDFRAGYHEVLGTKQISRELKFKNSRVDPVEGIAGLAEREFVNFEFFGHYFRPVLNTSKNAASGSPPLPCCAVVHACNISAGLESFNAAATAASDFAFASTTPPEDRGTPELALKREDDVLGDFAASSAAALSAATL